ncbi:TPA: glucosyltransferase domain-containing protein [Citrobacter sedlakii]|nr:glucosyltransferase domain-containing protein [Citrobacter sedlakii]
MKKFNFYAVAAISILYCLPIILGTSYYYDDLFRAYSGYSSWDSDGRPFANLFYQLVTFGQTMPDTFPFALILSILIFAYVGYKLGKIYNVGSSYAYSISYAMIIMSPLFISNLLFRYDSSFMLLAVTAAIAPYVINIEKRTNIFFGTFAIIASFGLYQAAVSIFIAFAGIELFRSICLGNAKEAIKSCLIRVFQLAIAYIIYSKVLLDIFVINDYFKSFNKPISLNGDGFAKLIGNLLASLHHIKLMLSPGFLIAFTPVACYSLFCLIRYTITSKRYLVILGFVTSLIALFISVPGIAIFGENPVFYPRIYIGVGALFFFICYIPVILNGNKKVTIAVQLLFTFYLVGMVNATSNAVRTDIEFQKDTTQRILNIIDSNNISTNHKLIILGQLRQSPLSFVNSLSYPLISVLSPQFFIGGYDGGRYMLMHGGLDNIENPTPQEQSKYRDMLKKARPLSVNNLFSLYSIDSTTIVSFENTSYDEINSTMKPYLFKSKMITDAYYGDNYFYACISNDVSPTLKRSEWYYLLINTKDGSVFNRNFFVPFSINKKEGTCVVTQWEESIPSDDVTSIQFGIYNTKSMQRRVDLGS